MGVRRDCDVMAAQSCVDDDDDDDRSSPPVCQKSVGCPQVR